MSADDDPIDADATSLQHDVIDSRRFTGRFLAMRCKYTCFLYYTLKILRAILVTSLAERGRLLLNVNIEG